jgi:hypothetical protein
MTSSIEALPTSALAFVSTRVPIADVGESVVEIATGRLAVSGSRARPRSIYFAVATSCSLERPTKGARLMASGSTVGPRCQNPGP